MLILRTTDRIPCKIGNLILWVAPLSWDERTKIYSLGKNKESLMAFETLRASIKKVDGYEGYVLSDGSSFVPGYDESGKLNEISLELIARIAGFNIVSILASALITDNFNDKLDGISIDMEKIYNIEESSKKKS